MFKYNNIAENCDSYKIPSTKHSKYKLDIGELFFPIHNSINDECKSISDINLYNVKDEMFNNLINEIKIYNNINNDNNSDIIITNGSDNALRLILEVFATPNSNLLIPTPTYPHFESMLKVHKINNLLKVNLNYKQTNNEIFEIIKENLSKNEIDLCYIVNPNMPIGYMFSKENVINLLINFPNTIFIFDEAYIEFSDKETLATLVNNYNNLIITKTFSKFFGLASLRIGYLITNKKFIKLIDPYYNQKDITKVAINCAYKSLKNIDFYNENKKRFLQIRDYLRIKLNEIVNNNSKLIDWFLNDGMYFTIIAHDPYGLTKHFENNSIAVRNKNDDIKGAIRITIADKEIMDEVINVLSKW